MLGVLPVVEDPDLSWSAAPALPQHLPPWALHICKDTNGNSGRTNKKVSILARQVNDRALGELEAANAETGSLNGFCTLPVSQCGRGSLCLCIAFGAWCCGVWLWCSRAWCGFALAYTSPLHRLSKAMNGGHSAYSPCKSVAQRETWLRL